MNTFGPINWREYYSISYRHRVLEAKERREVERLIKALTQLPPECPCMSCRNAIYVHGCNRAVRVETITYCRKWGVWFREAWRIVTEKLKGEIDCEQ